MCWNISYVFLTGLEIITNKYTSNVELSIVMCISPTSTYVIVIVIVDIVIVNQKIVYSYTINNEQLLRIYTVLIIIINIIKQRGLCDVTWGNTSKYVVHTIDKDRKKKEGTQR